MSNNARDLQSSDKAPVNPNNEMGKTVAAQNSTLKQNSGDKKAKAPPQQKRKQKRKKREKEKCAFHKLPAEISLSRLQFYFLTQTTYKAKCI